MNNLRKIVISMVLLIAISLIVTFAYFYIKINEKYPAPLVQEVAMDTPFEYSFDKNFKITVTDFSILNEEELLKLDEEAGLSTNEESNERIGYLVTLKIKNIGTNEASIENQVFTLQSGIFNNGSDMAFNMVLNQDVKSGPYKPGEERTIIMAFTAMRIHFRKEHWDNVENLKYELVTSLYPIEQKVLLK